MRHKATCTAFCGFLARSRVEQAVSHYAFEYDVETEVEFNGQSVTVRIWGEKKKDVDQFVDAIEAEFP